MRLTARVTCDGAGGGTPSDEKKAEAEKLLEKRADSPASSARFVRQQVITEPTPRQEKSLGARRIAGKMTGPTAFHIMTRERAEQHCQFVTISIR